MLGLVLTVLVITGCSGTSSRPAPTAAAHRSAAEACLAAAESGHWQLAAEIDRADSSVLALTDDASIMSCTTGHANGVFGPTSVGTGIFPVPAKAQLSYLTSVLRDQEPIVLVGRTPTGTSRVTLHFGDGSTAPTTLGGGIWLAWLETGATPVGIEAVDASGAVIGRIVDAAGVQPRG